MVGKNYEDSLEEEKVFGFLVYCMEYKFHIFSPYRVCPLGAHVDHQHGLVTGFAIDKGVDRWFNVREDSLVKLSSRTFEGDVEFHVNSNLAHYMVEHTAMHAWPMSAGRYDMISVVLISITRQ